MKCYDFLISLPNPLPYAKELNKQGFTVGIIKFDDPNHIPGPRSFLQNEQDQVVNNGKTEWVDFNKIIAPEDSSNVDIQRLCTLFEEKYQLRMHSLIFVEKAANGAPENVLRKKAIGIIHGLERFFQSNKVNSLVLYPPANIFELCIYYIGRSLNIPTIFMGENIFPNKMILYNNELNKLDFPIYSYKEMSPQDIASIEEYIATFTHKKEIFKYTSERDLKGVILYRLLIAIDLLKRKHSVAIYHGYIKPRIELLRRRLCRLRGSLYSSLDPQENYFFFPFHDKCDTQITLRNPHFYHQENLIEFTARSLPTHYSLYIKEHPFTGMLPSFSTLKKLAKIDNVKVLPVDTNSHDIIRNARGIITINSTVGFEALHYFKPVIVLGNWYLRGKGATIDVNNLSDLPAAINQALHNTINKEKIKSLLFSLMKACYDGSIYSGNISYPLVVQSLVKKALAEGASFSKN